MLMIENPTPDLAVEALMPDGRFERLRLGSLLGRWAVLFFIPETSPSSARPRSAATLAMGFQSGEAQFSPLVAPGG